MKIRNNLILILVFMLIDDLVGFLCGMDPTYSSFSFNLQSGLLCLLLITAQNTPLNSFLLAMLSGILMDFLFSTNFPLHTILYSLLGLLSSFIGIALKDHTLRRTFICYFLMVLFDFLVFGLMSIFGNLTVSFTMWFTSHMIGTLIVNAFAIAFLQYVFIVMERYQAIRAHRISRQEKRKYRRLRLSRK